MNELSVATFVGNSKVNIGFVRVQHLETLRDHNDAK